MLQQKLVILRFNLIFINKFSKPQDKLSIILLKVAKKECAKVRNDSFSMLFVVAFSSRSFMEFIEAIRKNKIK